MRSKAEIENKLIEYRTKRDFWLEKLKEAEKEYERINGYPYHLYENYDRFDARVKALEYVLGLKEF